MSGNATQNTLKNVPVADILVRDGFNTRSEAEVSSISDDIRVLAQDIITNGLVTPLQVEPADVANKFYLVAGHRRLSAINYANTSLDGNIKTVPAVVKRGLDDDQRDAILLSDRLARALDPLATSRAFVRYMERNGLSQTQAAERFRMTVAYAGDMKLLANAPEPIQEAVEQHVVSATEAVRAIKEYGEDGAEKIVQELAQEVEQEQANAPDVEQTDAQPSAADVATTAISRAKRTRKDVERVAKTTNVAPKRIKPPKDNLDTTTQTTPLPDLTERVAYTVDNLLAQFQAENMSGVRAQISKLGYWLREYQRNGYVVKDSMSGINADTPDAQLDWGDTEQREAA